MTGQQRRWLGVGCMLAASMSAGTAWGQQFLAGSGAKAQDASLVVDGVVREVFRSPRRSGTDYILLVEVKDANLGPNRKTRVMVPAPGEFLYVHADGPTGRDEAVPGERSQVRLNLSMRDTGGWELTEKGASLVSNEPAPAGAHDPEPAAEVAVATAPPATPAPVPAPAAADPLRILGVQAEVLQVQGRLVLKVTGVAADGPAAKAGIEKDDVIVGVNNAEFSSLDGLTKALQAGGGKNTLLVLDVRTAKATPVPIDVTTTLAAEAQKMPAPAPTAPAARTIGVGVRPIKLGGGRTGLEVVELAADGAGAKAGLEKGDVIAGVNGQAVSTSEQLAAAVQQSGDSLTLIVVDSRTGKAVELPVAMSGAPAGPTTTTPTTPSTPTAPAGNATALGVVTEQVTVEFVPALKVVKVAPGSPAEKAGLEVGDVIFSANDTVTIVPELLEKAARESGGELKLLVLDPKTQQKTDVKVQMR